MIENFLKKLKDLGWTQKAIEAKTGVPQQMISRYMKGERCYLETAIKIADAFNVPLDEVANRMVTGKDNKSREKSTSASHTGNTNSMPCAR